MKTQNRVQRHWVHALICVICLLVPLSGAGCSARKTPETMDEVTVQLKWLHQAQFAGFYLAAEKGYYAEEHLKINLVEGGPNIDLVEQVVNGPADFGVNAPEQLFEAGAKGLPIKAIAVILRRNPMVFISLTDLGITRPEQMLGHSFAILGSQAEPQYQAMMEKLNLDMSTIPLLPYEYDMKAFYARGADMTIGYSTGSLIRIQNAGYDVNVIWPSDYGVHLYADTIFTTDQVIAERPEVVTRFLRATLRGWREAVEKPEDAVVATLKYAKEADRELQMRMMQASVPLIFTGEDQIGWMEKEIWQGMYDLLKEQAVLTATLDPANLFTMQFLQEVYDDGGQP